MSYGLFGSIPRKTGSLISKELPPNGNRSWKIISTQPPVEPVTLDEVKEFAHIDGTEEDCLLERFITSARYSCEEYLRRALVLQTIQMVMDFWPDTVVELPRPPLISVSSVVTVDEDNNETTYSSDNYYIVTEAIPGQLVLKQGISPPTNTSRNYAGFKITYQCGYGATPGNIPAPIRDGLVMWVTTMYAKRVISKEPPPDAKASLDLFRVLRY